MSSPLPMNAKRGSRDSPDYASSHINENVLAGSFDRAESIARLSSSPMPSHNFGTSPAQSTHSINYGTNNNNFLSVNRPHSPFGDNHSVDMPDEEVARAVKRHLVSTSPSGSSFHQQYLNTASPRRSVASRHSHRGRDSDDDEDDEDDNEHLLNVHQLPGGAITHDIYKWTEDQERRAKMKRSKSVMVARTGPTDPALVNLKDPGGFRRHYVIDRAVKKGKKPPGWITHSFVDFLAMYGHFGGEDLSDDEGMSSDEEEDLTEGSDERTALLRQARANAVEGTATPTKAVFLLLKSFIGTGKGEFIVSSI